jgi:hypothetical protein
LVVVPNGLAVWSVVTGVITVFVVVLPVSVVVTVVSVVVVTGAVPVLVVVLSMVVEVVDVSCADAWPGEKNAEKTKAASIALGNAALQ